MKILNQPGMLLPERFNFFGKSGVITFIIIFINVLTSIGATITSFAPANGPVGTLISIKGADLSATKSVTIGGVAAIIVSNGSTKIIAMVMPGATTGAVSVTSSGGTTTATGSFTVEATPYPIAQQGIKMADKEPASDLTYYYHYKTKAVAVSADGNMAIVSLRYGLLGGGAIIYTRKNGRWQQASPFIDFTTDSGGYDASSGVVTSVAVSADGSTAVVGGTHFDAMPVLVLRSVNGSWSQPLVERLKNPDYQPDAYPQFEKPYASGNTVSITADGRTILVLGGIHESSYTRNYQIVGDGLRIFNRIGSGWSQVPTPRIPNYQYLGIPKSQSYSLPDIGGTISADGKTVALIAQSHHVRTGKNTGYDTKPYTIIYGRATRNSNVWVPQHLFNFYSRVQLSADGNTLLATLDAEDYLGVSAPGSGSTDIYTRTGNTWSLAQVINEDGEAVLSADGSTLLIANNATVYTRSGGSYIKKVVLKSGYYATSAALSADGSTAFVGNPYDSGSLSSNNFTGAVYAFNTAPQELPASGIIFDNTTSTATSVSWTNGTGTGRAIFIKDTTAGEPSPEDVYYTANKSYRLGSQAGKSSWYCIYNGSGTTVNVTGLTNNKTYRVAVMEYKGTLNKPVFLQTEVTPANVATPVTPPADYATALTFTNTSTDSTTLSWVNGAGSKRAVFLKLGTAGVPHLINGSVYGAQRVFAQGTEAGAGWYCIYNGTGNSVNITGLAQGGTYTASVVEYNGSNGAQTYFVSGFSARVTLPVAAPDFQSYGLAFYGKDAATMIDFNYYPGSNPQPAGYAIFAKELGTDWSYGYNYSGVPSPGTASYAANNKFGAGAQIDDTGWFCVYNGPYSPGVGLSVTGLQPNTFYRITAVAYNGSKANPVYISSDYLQYSSDNWRTSAYNPPSGYATALTFSNTTATSSTLSWTNGTGASRAVFIKKGSLGAPEPVNSYQYTASNPFTQGSPIYTLADNTDWYCVYTGTGSSVNLLGLSPSSTYRVAVVDYNGDTYPSPISYVAHFNGANVTTLPAPGAPATPPTGYATALTFSNTAATTTTLSWVSSNGTARAVFLKQGASGAINVLQGHAYAANNTLGLGDMAGTNGWYCVYNGTGSSVNIAGLSASSTYRATVLEYNGTAGAEGYNLSRYNAATVTTMVAPAMVLTTNQKQMLVGQEVTQTEVNIHQALSPNGDGDNDVFTIDGIGAYPQNTVKIMNSNGDVIYTAAGYDNYLKAFDGHSTKGTMQKAGTYFYSLEYKKGAETIRHTGYLVIKY